MRRGNGFLVRDLALTFVVGSLWMLALPAQAGKAAKASEEEVPLFGWASPDATAQLAADETEVPAGLGALFVPTMTRGTDEPPLIVLDAEGKKKIAAGHTGERIVVEPGSYVVAVGSGPTDQMSKVSVVVATGETALVEPTWGGLRIEVVDELLIGHRGAYEVIRMDDRDVFGIGYGADSLQAETLQTWLLPPGLYRIVQPGGSFRSRVDYATVTVPEAGLVRYRLVMDPITTSFKGAGVMLPGEFGTSVEWDRAVTGSLVLGGDASFSHTSNVVGMDDQISVNGNLFLEGQVIVHKKHHYFSALLDLEEGLSFSSPIGGDRLPLMKSKDRLRSELLYSYLVKDWFGPYVRAGVQTQLVPSEVVATEAQTLSVTDLDGNTETVNLAPTETFRISEAFSPTSLREGGGLNFRPVHSRFVTLSTRLGVGARQNLYRDTFVLLDDEDTAAIEYAQVETYHQFGMEATLLATFRFTNWLMYMTDFEFFSDFRDFGAPTIEWNNTVSLRITHFLSLNYTAELVREPAVSPKTQFQHAALLRVSVNLF